MCLFPRLIENKKYRANQKNGGVIPPIVDERVRYVPVGCETCIECRKQKARSWQVRLSEDIKHFKNGKFVTLTFSTESLKAIYDGCDKLKDLKGYDLDNAIATRAVRLFLERWRKKYKKSVRHWLVTELGHGTTEHLHLHGIIWCDDVNEIEKFWGYGYVWKGNKVYGKLENYVTAKTVNYIVKYITKVDSQHMNFKCKVLCSAGIGKGFIDSGHDKRNKFAGAKTKEDYRLENGFKLNMPIYFRNKIYSEKEREQLWLMKLDKNERWVCGERIRIRSEEDERKYFALVEYHRNRTMELGYRSPDFIWKRRAYEEQRRKMLQEQRLRSAGLIV